MSELKIDRETMGRLAKGLAFITTPDNPAVLALKKAAETGNEKDIKAAYAAFLKVRSGERAAALGMLSDD
jgi:hypothetical protein